MYGQILFRYRQPEFALFLSRHAFNPAFERWGEESLLPLMEELGYPSTAEEIRSRLARLTPDHHTLVAEVSGELAGFIGLVTMPVYEHSAPIGYILAFSIGTAHQRQGVGRALLEAAEEHFLSRGVHDIRVNSGLQREGAHRFYEATGYTKTGFRFRKVLGGES